jgi:predicted transcriptional regulator
VLIRIPKSVDKRLTRMARVTRRTKASIAQQAIETYLPIFEEIDREEKHLARTEERKRRIKLGKFLKPRRLP